MGTSIKTRITKVGGFHTIRIPKYLLNRSGLGEEVELVAERNQIVIRSARRPRAGWEEQFRRMAELGDDRLLDGEIPGLSSWDEKEWEWE